MRSRSSSSPPLAPSACCVCLSCVIARGPGMRSAHTQLALAAYSITKPQSSIKKQNEKKNKSNNNYYMRQQHCIDNKPKQINPQPLCVPKWDPPIPLRLPLSPNPLLSLTLYDIAARPCAVEKMFSHSTKYCNDLPLSTLSARQSSACPSSPAPLPSVLCPRPCSHFLPVAKLATYIVYIVNECDTFNL